MAAVLILALPLSVFVMGLTGELNWQGFVLGYILSLIVLRLANAHRLTVSPARAPLQIVYALLFMLRLVWDIFTSSIDVVRILLSPNMPLQPGVIPVKTGDKKGNDIVTALSSHSITITPGQLVSDVDDTGKEHVMMVHCLNTEKAAASIQDEQISRLARIRKVLGYDG